MPAMLAVLTENGPAHSKGVLAELKAQHRVTYGVTMSDAHEACEMLVAEGKLAVARAGGRHFKVPRDDRERWDK